MSASDLLTISSSSSSSCPQALLLTVEREQREMKELDSARDALMDLCTAGGRDALTLEVSHLHDLCSSSEQQLRQRLLACEAALRELDSQLTGRNQGLKERAAAIQWELRSLDQALGYSEPQVGVDGLQQHWTGLQVPHTSALPPQNAPPRDETNMRSLSRQNCQKSLQDLGVKVGDLHREVKDFPGSDEPPTETVMMVDSLVQQHDRFVFSCQHLKNQQNL